MHVACHRLTFMHTFARNILQSIRALLHSCEKNPVTYRVAAAILKRYITCHDSNVTQLYKRHVSFFEYFLLLLLEYQHRMLRERERERERERGLIILSYTTLVTFLIAKLHFPISCAIGSAYIHAVASEWLHLLHFLPLTSSYIRYEDKIIA